MKKQYFRFFGQIIGCQLLLSLLISIGQCKTPVISDSKIPTTLTLEMGRAEALPLDLNTSEIFVANPEIADVQLNTSTDSQPNAPTDVQPNKMDVAYVFGKRPGTTTVFLKNESGKTVSIDVKVTHNLSELNQIVRQTYPEEQIKFFSISQGIVMQGQVKYPIVAANIEEMAKKYLGPKDQLINNVSISNPTQIMLKVKIAEVNRNALNKLGINWSAMFRSAGKTTFGFLTGRNPLATVAASEMGSNIFERNSPGTDASGSIGARFSDGVSNFTALIDALNKEGLASVLAEPNLIALSGETASFLSGGEFPYPVPQDQSITLQFKQFGVSLSFTPTVSSNHLIHLKVRPEVSDLDYVNSAEITTTSGKITVPGIKTRRAETSVQLGSGQSLAIAGLIRSDFANTFSELPGIGDIPFLGALFRSSQFKSGQSELVIIVTPYVIQPISDPSALKLPTDSLKYASNLEIFFFQRLNRLKDGNPLNLRIAEPQLVKFDGAAGFNVLE